MKKLLNLLLLLFISNFTFSQQYNLKFNEVEKKIYYENVLDFDGKSVSNLKEKVKKFLALERAVIRYEDENEIIATGVFDVIYRSHFLFIFKTHKYNLLSDIKISFKENKIKYNITNFYLIPKNIKLNTMSWYSKPTNYGMAGWSTTKIPTDIPKKPLEVHYHKTKLKPKYKIFPDVDGDMANFERKLIQTINENEDNW